MNKKVLALAIAACSATVTANAQQLEEVLVTAQKRAQSMNDIGISVNAFSGDDIHELGVNSVTDMAEHTPGLIYNEAGGLGVPVYTIRGVGFDDYSVASNSTVGVYIDEVSLPYPVMTRGQMFDVERVEVLKGPQGDLYGRNTTGGAINFVSNKPSDEYEAGITVGYGSEETFQSDGYVSGPLSNKTRGRLAFSTTQSNEGWMDSQTRDEELGEIDSIALRGQLAWDASDSVNVRFNIHYNQNKSENAGQVRSGQLGATVDPFTGPLTEPSGWLTLPLAAAGLGDAGIPVADAMAPAGTEDTNEGDWTPGFSPENDNKLIGGSITVNWDLADFTLTSITAYDKFERDDAFDWDGTRLQLFDQLSSTDIDAWSQELRLTSSGDGDFNWILGAYFSYDEIEDNYVGGVGDSSGSNGIFTSFGNKIDQETTTASVFGHSEWQFDEQWRLVLGGRYTHEEREADACSYDSDGGNLAFLFSGLDLIDFDLGGTGDDFFLSSTVLGPGDCVTVDQSLASAVPDGNGPGTIVAYGGESGLFSDDFSVDDVSGKIGLDWLPNDDWLVYASIGTGFKSGGYNGAAASATLQLEPYDEEKLLAYELGFKATLLDGSMQLNGAAFFYDYEDKQVLSVINDEVFGPLAVLVNVPESEIFGAELEGTWLPTEALTLNFGLSYLDTEITDYTGFHPLAPDLGDSVNFEGAELGSSPELTANLRATYEWQLGGTLYMRLTGDASYKDSYFSGIEYVNPTDERFKTDDYTLTNARATLGSQDGVWDVSAWVRNIGDEYYYHSVSFSNDAITRGLGRGRTWGLSATYRWM